MPDSNLKSAFKGKLGYIVPEFPQQTHIFFWREIQALEGLGIPVQIISTKRVDSSKVKHKFAELAEELCFYLHPVSMRAFIFLLLHPFWFACALKYVASLDESFKEKCLCLYYILIAANLLAFASKNNIRHFHGHSCANVAHILSMSSLFKGVSYSLTLHGGMDNYGVSHRQKMIRARFVSTVTRPLQSDIINDVGLAKEKVPVISMGVDLSKFIPASSQKLSGPIKFISVARLAIGKGHQFSLEALKRLADNNIEFEYSIVGGGPDEHEIREQVRLMGLSAFVHFHGTLSEDEILPLLQSSHVLLLTSFGSFEAAPVCVMEAMACGLPTITSIIGGTADMIDSDVDGFLVEQKNVDQIESAMVSLSQDRALLARMGLNARKSAEQKFDFVNQAGQLASYFK